MTESIAFEDAAGTTRVELTCVDTPFSSPLSSPIGLFLTFKIFNNRSGQRIKRRVKDCHRWSQGNSWTPNSLWSSQLVLKDLRFQKKRKKRKK